MSEVTFFNPEETPTPLLIAANKAPVSGPALAGVPRSAGGGGGPGGLDMNSLLQNPAIMNMAQQMMANGGLENLMRNPALSNMMNRVQSGGGMPSMSELMSDPTMRQMAETLRNSGGAGAPPGPGPGSS